MFLLLVLYLDSSIQKGKVEIMKGDKGMTKKEGEMFLKVLELVSSKGFKLTISPPSQNQGVWRVVLSTQEGLWHIGEGMLFQVFREILKRKED